MVGRIEIFAQQNFTHIVLFLAIFVDFNELLPDFSDFLENAEQVERLEDLFEKSDMKMENGNMGSESSKKLKCCSGKIP